MFYSQTEVWSEKIGVIMQLSRCRTSEFPIDAHKNSNICTYLGKSFPFCEATVADLASTPPDADLAILLMAADDPVRGPDAL